MMFLACPFIVAGIQCQPIFSYQSVTLMAALPPITDLPGPRLILFQIALHNDVSCGFLKNDKV